MVMKIFDRYHDIVQSSVVSDRFLIRWQMSAHVTDSGMRIDVYRYRFPIVRETNACFVIDDYGEQRFVLKEQNGKRFAYLSDKAAIHSLRRRNLFRRMHAQNAIDACDLIDAKMRELFTDDNNLIVVEADDGTQRS